MINNVGMITLIRKEKVPGPVLTQKLKQQSMIFSKSDNLVPPCWRYLTRFEENCVPLDQQRPRQVNQLPISSIYISFLRCTVSDPYSLYTDPDPASNLNTDLAPGFFSYGNLVWNKLIFTYAESYRSKTWWLWEILPVHKFEAKRRQLYTIPGHLVSIIFVVQLNLFTVFL